MLPLEQTPKLLSIQFARSQYLSQESWPDGFAGMNKDYGSTTIFMPKEVMAAANAHRLEARAPQRLDHFHSGQRG